MRLSRAHDHDHDNDEDDDDDRPSLDEHNPSYDEQSAFLLRSISCCSRALMMMKMKMTRTTARPKMSSARPMMLPSSDQLVVAPVLRTKPSIGTKR